MDKRFHELVAWTSAVLGKKIRKITALSNDASVRRYFSLTDEGLVAVDTPLPVEQNKAFISIAKTFTAYHLNVPQVFRYDLKNGYMLLSDLGRRTYLSELSPKNVEKLYSQAIEALIVLQSIPRDGFKAHTIESFDHRFIAKEGALCQEWFLEKYLGIELNPQEKASFQKTISILTLNNLEQPQVLVHRDYHSRNLMMSETRNPGIIDFQDAVWGPITYDLVSLIRDCYIAWPAERVERWVSEFQLQLQDLRRFHQVSKEQFQKWFDLAGAQRHLKALGIFARCDLLYKKPGYLKDIPRTLHYVIAVAEKYPELHFLKYFIDERVLPHMEAKAELV